MPIETFRYSPTFAAMLRLMCAESSMALSRALKPAGKSHTISSIDSTSRTGAISSHGFHGAVVKVDVQLVARDHQDDVRDFSSPRPRW